MRKQLPLPLSEPLQCKQCGKDFTIPFNPKVINIELYAICPDCHERNVKEFISELRQGKK